MSQYLLEQATLPESSATPPPPCMLVFAHADDEVVALGARLGRFQSALFVHVTDGAPRNEQDSRAHGFATLDDYRRCREKELSSALRLAGLQSVQRVHLDIPDQEASFHLPRIAQQLRRLTLDQKIEVVFTHPYEGGHPDHDACAFAVHRAMRSAKLDGETSPVIVEASFYHAGPNGFETGCFLQHKEQTAERCCVLSAEEQQRKQALLACFTSQQQTLGYLPNDRECFRIAPHYDFYQPPHSQILYERFPWGMTSHKFCELARAADVLDSEENSPCL